MTNARGEVLFSEIDVTQCTQTAHVLRTAGFAVVEVGNAEAAAQALRSRGFDVFLADLEMPGNTKLELLNLMREHALPVPVVLMARRPTVETAIEALRCGVVDYVSKPLDFSELNRRLDHAIEHGRRSRAMQQLQKTATALAESFAALQSALSLAQPPFGPESSREPVSAGDPLAHIAATEVQRLSPRELEVARLLARGKAVGAVAAVLELSPNTVRNHIKSVFVKLRVHSQVELLSKLAGHGA